MRRPVDKMLTTKVRTCPMSCNARCMTHIIILAPSRCRGCARFKIVCFRCLVILRITRAFVNSTNRCRIVFNRMTHRQSTNEMIRGRAHEKSNAPTFEVSGVSLQQSGPSAESARAHAPAQSHDYSLYMYICLGKQQTPRRHVDARLLSPVAAVQMTDISVPPRNLRLSSWEVRQAAEAAASA